MLYFQLNILFWEKDTIIIYEKQIRYIGTICCFLSDKYLLLGKNLES